MACPGLPAGGGTHLSGPRGIEGESVDVHTYLTGNGRCADHAPALALLDELYRGVLVAEENALYVDVDHPVDGLGGNWGCDILILA